MNAPTSSRRTRVGVKNSSRVNSASRGAPALRIAAATERDEACIFLVNRLMVRARGKVRASTTCGRAHLRLSELLGVKSSIVSFVIVMCPQLDRVCFFGCAKIIVCCYKVVEIVDFIFQMSKRGCFVWQKCGSFALLRKGIILIKLNGKP